MLGAWDVGFLNADVNPSTHGLQRGPRKIVKKPIDVPQVQYVDKIVRSSEQASPRNNLWVKGFLGVRLRDTGFSAALCIVLHGFRRAS